METIRGGAGTAELVRFEPMTLAQQATLALWLIDAPGQSPAWSHYGLSVIHLREIEGAEPAFIRIPGATHEIILAALDPDAHPTADDVSSFKPLTPINAEAQFTVDTDEQAIALAEKCVRAICSGHMPAEPLLPGGQYWQETVARTAEHTRTGGHAG